MQQNRHVSFDIKVLSNLILRYMNKSTSKPCISGVTESNGWIIAFLAKNQDKDIFQRDLEEELTIRRSTVSSILQLMEKKGLIERIPVDYDARLKKLVLTDKAHEIYAAAKKAINELEQKLTKGLTEEELTVFFKIIDKIKDNIV